MSTIDDAEAIRTLIARIAHTADAAHDIEETVLLYTPDAVWELGDTRVVGHDDLRAAAEVRRREGRAGPGTFSRHLVSTVAVAVHGNTGVADSYWQFFTHTGGQPHLDSMGAYRDKVVRTEEGWRVSRRTITAG
ncbi:nuclear transport factor 2 family protein [Humibacter sp.]|uniref:nuclear transport factor 2 family protein n=1 Tax=Humibacter sp. TaxID=1940291 RepID=UPI002CED440A|nr:nuclear transport factor 2 family protein [Humibacter sp.]HVX09156.1 nuclear transport factor 2 family protein [Humibacter sp.]